MINYFTTTTSVCRYSKSKRISNVCVVAIRIFSHAVNVVRCGRNEILDLYGLINLITFEDGVTRFDSRETQHFDLIG